MASEKVNGRNDKDSSNNNDNRNDREGADNRDISRRRVAWADDETLGSYMLPPVKSDRINNMVQTMKSMDAKGMKELMKGNNSNGI